MLDVSGSSSLAIRTSDSRWIVGEEHVGHRHWGGRGHRGLGGSSVVRLGLDERLAFFSRHWRLGKIRLKPTKERWLPPHVEQRARLSTIISTEEAWESHNRGHMLFYQLVMNTFSPTLALQWVHLWSACWQSLQQQGNQARGKKMMASMATHIHEPVGG